MCRGEMGRWKALGTIPIFRWVSAINLMPSKLNAVQMIILLKCLVSVRVPSTIRFFQRECGCVMRRGH